MMRYHLTLYDDGVLLYGAERVLACDVPYKDFWFVYTPGNLYVLAFIFKIFGSTVIIARIFNTIISFSIVLMSYLLARKIIHNKIAIIIFIYLTTLCVWLNGLYANQNIPILFALISSLYFLKYIEQTRKLYLIISGLMLGITSLFRMDFGLYIFLTISILLLLLIYHKSILKPINGYIQFLKTWLILLASAITIIFPVLLYFVLKVPFQDLVNQLILFYTVLYAAYQTLPYPLPLSIYDVITMYFPPMMFIFTVIWIVSQRKKRKMVTEKDWIVIFVLILGLISMNSVIVKPISFHMYLAMLTAIILFSYFYSKYVKIHKILNSFLKLEIRKHCIWHINIYYTFFTIIMILFFTSFSFNMVHDTINEYTLPLDTEKGYGILVTPTDQDLETVETANYIRINVPSTEKIFIGNSRHDRLTGNVVLLYFLTDRESATKYSEMIPGVVTRGSVQNEIIEELQENNVKYIVLFKGWDGISIPNRSNESSGVTNLDDYIQKNYYVYKIIGNYTILRIKYDTGLIN